MSGQLRSIEIYPGDQPTDTQWRVTTLDIAEPVFVYQTSLWIGAAREHRGDLLCGLFVVHESGAEDKIDTLPWDHYREESIRPQDKNFTPFYFEAEPGSRIEFRYRGAAFDGQSWAFLPTAKIWFRNTP